MLYVAIIICVLLSAFFSMSEMSFLSADRLQVELDKSQDNAISKIQEHFYKFSSRFITTTLIGNNIVNVVYALFAAMLLEPPLSRIISNDLVVVLIQIVISTAIVILFSEYLPKMIGSSKPNLMLRIFSIPLFIVYVVLFPLTMLISWISNLIFWLLGVKNEKNTVQPLGKVDLDYFIEAHVTDEEKSAEAKLLQNAIDFSEVKLRDCLVPRNEIMAVPLDTPKDELLEIFSKSGYSKIPVYKEDMDDIIGYIHTIEMYNLIHKEKWQDRVLPVLYLSESQSAESALKLLMQQKMSVAIVIDELGGTSGMVTLEDIVEEIFGDIEDEHDTSRIVMRQVSDNEYIISGRAEVDNLNEKFDLGIPENDEYQTLAGFILTHYQEIPERGEEITIPPHFQLRVMRATGNKVTLVRLRKIEP